MSDFDFTDHKVIVCDPQQEAIDIAQQTYQDVQIGAFFSARTAADLLKQIPKVEPDIILISLKLDDMNAIEAVQKIRGLEKGKFYTTPVLIILERASQSMLREACRAGIEGALRKPLSPDKIIRFSRAVILKPRRFICVRHYFGPERRMRSDPHFQGEDRRQGTFSSEDTNIRTYTAPSQSGPRGTVLSSGKPAWAVDSTSKPKSAGSTLGLGSDTTKSADGNTGEAFDLSGGGPESSKEKMDYDLTDSGPSDDTQKEGDFDFGFTETKPDGDNAKIDFSAEEKPAQEAKDLEAAPSQPDKTEKLEGAEKGEPDEEEYEEIIDLEECLELHKEWINSGGKRGQRANRPNSDFRGKELTEADFTSAALPQSNFEEVKCDKVVLRKADLRGSTFKNTLLSGADLRVSRLAQADLRNARLDRANLLGADLTGANLEGATMRGVNLSGANLTRTNLRGVNLASVQGLIPDQIKRAITDQTTRLPLGHK